MIQLALLAEDPSPAQHAPERFPEDIRCPLSGQPSALVTLTSALCDDLAPAGCPLAATVQERLRFETLLAELSAAFVNLPASRVDSRIEAALQQVVTFLGLDRGGLAELSADERQLVITHSYHMPGIPPHSRIILNEQLPWYANAVLRGDVLRFSALPDELPAEAVEEREYCLRIGLKSHAMIPVNVNDAVVGAIGFASFRGSYDWSDDLIQRLRLVGEIFTNALARRRADETLRVRDDSLRRTREDRRELAGKLLHAQEEERRRIAREMHDDWAQRLAILGIEVAKLEKFLGDAGEALPLIRIVQEQLEHLADDVHAVSRQLHPSILEDLGLVDALRSECAGFSHREGIAVAYHPEPLVAGVPKDVSLCVYRVAQEALRNIAKHAAVNEASVTLSSAGPELILRVEDKGVGFDASVPHPRPGLGLSSMAERVRIIQATLIITAAPGMGTTVEVRVPLTPSDP